MKETLRRVGELDLNPEFRCGNVCSKIERGNSLFVVAV
jgi:hypothetical protein